MAGPDRLYLIRHGETPWNRQGRYQGQRDVPLNARGRLQAWRLARALGRAGIAAVVSSALRRARFTASPLARRAGVPVQVDPDLNEIDFGRWEGLTLAQVRARYPEQLEAYLRDPVGYAPGGGEAFQAMADRVRRAYRRALEEAGPGGVALVAHGAVLKAIVCDLLGLSYRDRGRFAIDNGSVTLFRLGGRYPRLVLLNGTAHLAGEPRPWTRLRLRLRRRPPSTVPGTWSRPGPA